MQHIGRQEAQKIYVNVGFCTCFHDFYINIDVLIHEPDSYFDHNARVPTMQKMRNMNYLVFIMNTQLLRTYLNSNTLVQF